jgi:hypothetical protein
MHREFWEAGFHVFGLHGATKTGACGCGNPHCKAVYKHPLVSNWQNTPHWSEEQLEAYESIGQFDTGYGILCKNLLVIDVDARNGGVLSYENLINSYPQISLNAGLIVETGSGNGSKHIFFKLDHDLALLQHLDGYDGIDFKSSGFVVGAGSLHASGSKYKVVFGSPDQIQDAPQELLDLLRKPDRHRAVVNGMTYDVSHKDLADMLSFIDPDSDHDTWVRCGMACHHASGGTAFGIWDAWSARGSK